jgi:hypothetical protein
MKKALLLALFPFLVAGTKISVVYPEAPNGTNEFCSVTYSGHVSNAVIVVTATNLGIADSFWGTSAPVIMCWITNANQSPAGYYHLQVSTVTNTPVPPEAPTNLHIISQP